jgi:hypothetical protein
VSAQRVSFTVLFQAAADQIIAAADPVPLIGTIGRAVLDNLLPEHPRWRVKARFRKSGASTASSEVTIGAPSRHTHWTLR